MRIVDKERDYYDVGQGLGYDASVTYYRTRKEINLPGSSYGDKIYVGFCGNIYAGVYLSHYYNFDRSGAHVVVPAYCYKIEDVDRWVQDHYNSKDIDYYYGKIPKYRNTNWDVISRKPIVRFFDEAKTKTYPEYTKYFAEHNTPVFVVDYRYDYKSPQPKLYINPILRPYQFVKVKDPYTAYQEIEQYVGGVLLSPTPPIPDVPDNVMAEIKGFDPKWGFRKPPKKSR